MTGASAENEYDLLTAALIGVAIGVGTTLLLRSGPSGHSPAFAVVRGAGRAGRHLLPEQSRTDKMRRLVKRQVAGYAEAARAQVDDLAAEELRALRRAIRRRRKQLGI